MNFETSSFAL
jgi:hypothetical protein